MAEYRYTSAVTNGTAATNITPKIDANVLALLNLNSPSQKTSYLASKVASIKKRIRYKYRRLRNSNGIRLLKLRSPAWTAIGEPEIEFDLFEFPLDQTPTYTALSYTWDDQIPTEQAFCHGKSLLVTANVAAILRRLSRDPTTYYWIDSISINQGSLSERNCQVSLMGQIYENAAEVCIWLGQGDKQFEESITILEEMAELALTSPNSVEQRIQTLEAQHQTEYFAQYQTRGVPRSALLPEKFFPYFHPLFPVFQQQWFNRIWTLQEVVLARKAKLICGDRSMDWEKVSRVTSTMTEAKATSGFTLYPADVLQRVRVVDMLKGLLKGDEQAMKFSFRFPDEHPLGRVGLATSDLDVIPEPGIATHYFIASSLMASDPKDKVYGLYAILQKYGMKLLAPDYEKSVATIYQETAQAVIKHDSSLELLYSVSAPRVLPDLPSWVPDPSSGNLAWVPGHEFTSATKDSKARFSFDGHDGMTLHGIRIDVVRNTTAVFRVDQPFCDVDLRDQAAFLASLRKMFRVLQEWIVFALTAWMSTDKSEKPLHAFCMTVMQEIAFAFSKEPGKLSELVESFSAWASTLVTSIDDTDDSYAVEEEVFANIAGNKVCAVVHEILLARGDGNCLFDTRSGRLGMAIEGIQEGDEVYLVSGMRLPLVVRRHAGFFRLVGCVYLHGAMQGELWPQDSDKLVELMIR